MSGQRLVVVLACIDYSASQPIAIVTTLDEAQAVVDQHKECDSIEAFEMELGVPLEATAPPTRTWIRRGEGFERLS